MKKNNFLIIISVLTLMIATLGATFSFFRVMIKSNDETIAIGAANLGIELNTAGLYTGVDLLPIDDDKVMTAYNNKCVDIVGNGACSAYLITIKNSGQDMEYVGTIRFILNDLTNLNYMVLDENDNIYKDVSNIIDNTSLSLGENMNLLDGETKVLKLIVWIPNLDRKQDADDAGGSFTAEATFSSFAGSKVTGTFTH